MIRVNIEKTSNLISSDELKAFSQIVDKAHEKLLQGTGEGSDFLGWLNLPEKIDAEECSKIKACARKVRETSEVLLIIGIGGSFLGARAGIEFLKGSFSNQHTNGAPEIYFVGNNLSCDYINEIMDIIGNRDFSINVISKSGATTEPGISFRVFKEIIEKKYGKEGARERIYVTTDKSKGALRTLADNAGYESFVIPTDVGGRYSVLTAVGLFPMAVAGIDTDAVLEGAKMAQEALLKKRDFSNPAWLYVAVRNILYKKGKKVELLACFEPRFRYMSEWWKQLFGESEGKDNVGIFPASVEFAADLHSMGQYIQDGERILQETFVTLGTPSKKVTVPMSEENFDGLNYLAGRDFAFINENAHTATELAHRDGGTPNMTIELSEASEKGFGYLVYFFELSCGLSGYVLGVNPFNQPGVEAYKKNMFALLGKPGYEERRKEILEK